MRILLKRRDVNSNKADKHGTPLSWAAGSGYEGVVRILLERNDVNLTKYGRRSFSWPPEMGMRES